MTEGTLQATLTNYSTAIPDQTILFLVDTDDNGTPEEFEAITEPNGIATVFVQTMYPFGTYAYEVQWDGGVMQLSDKQVLSGVITLRKCSILPPHLPTNPFLPPTELR